MIANKKIVTGRPEILVARVGVRKDGTQAAPIFGLARPGIVPGSDLDVALARIEALLSGGAS